MGWACARCMKLEMHSCTITLLNCPRKEKAIGRNIQLNLKNVCCWDAH
jgi:hypothetical protein